MQLDRTISLSELSTLIDIKIVLGSHNYQSIQGINEIHKVRPGDLCFVDHPKYYDKVLQSAATVILIDTLDVANPLGKTLLLSDSPFSAYNTLVKHFRAQANMSSPISDTATIGQHTHIMSGAVIGNQVKIGNNCLILVDGTNFCIPQKGAARKGNSFGLH